MYLTVDEDATENVSWQEVEAAIANLDGETKCEVALSDDEGEMMMVIGGGKDNLVCVSYFEPSNPLHDASLLNPDPKGKEYYMCVGNQPSEISDEILVTKELALIAVHTFFTNRCLSDKLKWDI
jgi:hypothetical protein